MPVDTNELRYRYDGSGSGSIWLSEFRVVRHTKCGVWIDVYGVDKFVNEQATKRFACKTPREALDSLIARKKRQIRIIETNLANVREILRVAEVMRNKPQELLPAGKISLDGMVDVY